MTGVIAALGLNRAQLGELLRLRWRIALRRLTRERGRVVGMVLLTLFAVPWVLGMAVATGFGYLRLPRDQAAQLLGAVLVGLWLLWIVAPALSYRFNEGLDLTRLLVYPIRRRDLTAGLLLATLLELPTYLALPLFLAVLVGWAEGAVTVVVLAALGLAYAHMVLAGQVVLAGAGGLLTSRRYRDVSVIVLSLLLSSCYFVQRGAIAVGTRFVDPERLADVNVLAVLQWLPPGAAARAIERAAAGAWLASGTWLVYSAALLAAVAGLWWRLLVRLTTGGGFPFLGLPRAQPTEQAPRARASVVPGPLAWLPADLAQLVAKELRAAWRTPRRRVMLLQMLLMPLVLSAFYLLRGDGVGTVPDWSGLGLVGYALFAGWGMSQNMLGIEGVGLAALLLTPVPRWRVFLGKGIGMALMTGGAVLVLGTAVWVLLPGWLSVAGTLAALAVVPIAAGVGSVVSVHFPYPVNLESTSRRTVFATRGGCTAALANTFLLPLGIGLFSLPPTAVVGAAALLGLPRLGLAGGLGGMAYGGLVIWLGARLAGHQLTSREPEVLAATSCSGSRSS